MSDLACPKVRIAGCLHVCTLPEGHDGPCDWYPTNAERTDQ